MTHDLQRVVRAPRYAPPKSYVADPTLRPEPVDPSTFTYEMSDDGYVHRSDGQSFRVGDHEPGFLYAAWLAAGNSPTRRQPEVEELDLSVAIRQAEHDEWLMEQAANRALAKMQPKPENPEPPQEGHHNWPANMADPLSKWGEVGGEEASLTTADLTEEVIQRLTAAKRKKFTELLNVELAELQQERGGPREDLSREAEIEKLLGLFARVGEM